MLRNPAWTPVSPLACSPHSPLPQVYLLDLGHSYTKPSASQCEGELEQLYAILRLSPSSTMSGAILYAQSDEST